MRTLKVRLLIVLYKTLTSSHNGIIKVEFILENRNTTEEVNVNKGWFFEKINEINKSLNRLMKNKADKHRKEVQLLISEVKENFTRSCSC